MKLVVTGVNHRTAPVELREKLAYRPEEIPPALIELQARGAKEAVILSTCNRVELTAAAAEDFPDDLLLEALGAGRVGVVIEDLRPHLYRFEDNAAIRHLFRVAASLDSMIVGEPQILGQLKQAYAVAREHGSLGPMLDAVLTRAFSVAKRIRSETDIGRNAVSVSYAAVELAREIFGSLHKRRVLIVGAGKMSEGAARHLMNAGAEIFVTNRTPERAVEMAKVFRGETMRYEVFPQRLADLDVVITSSAAPEHILTREIVRRALEVRKHQPIFLIDIAVPRNIDPAVQTLEHAYLYDIDDLKRVADRNLQARQGVAQQAEVIVAEEVERLEAKLREREVGPVIVSLQEQLETIRQEALIKYRARLGNLTEEQQNAVEALSRAIVNKIAHAPISEMRREAAEQSSPEAPREAELASVVRRMFRLREK